MGDKYFLTVGIILLVCGVLMLAVLIRNKLTCTERVEATVCKVNKSKTFWKGKNIVSYQPVFAYKYGGKSYKTTATFSTNKKEQYPHNSKVDILVNPKNPSLIYVKKRVGLLINTVVDIALGIFIIILYFV